MFLDIDMLQPIYTEGKMAKEDEYIQELNEIVVPDVKQALHTTLLDDPKISLQDAADNIYDIIFEQRRQEKIDRRKNQNDELKELGGPFQLTSSEEDIEQHTIAPFEHRELDAMNPAVIEVISKYLRDAVANYIDKIPLATSQARIKEKRGVSIADATSSPHFVEAWLNAADSLKGGQKKAFLLTHLCGYTPEEIAGSHATSSVSSNTNYITDQVERDLTAANKVVSNSMFTSLGVRQGKNFP